MSFEEAIQHSYNPETDSVLIRDYDDPTMCERVLVPKQVMEKLFAKAHEFSSEPGNVADLCKRCISSVYADRKKQVSHWTWSKAKRMLTSLSIEHKALMRDSVMYDIRQLKKFHKEFKP